MNATLTVAASPHRREGETVPLIMWSVILALMPADVSLSLWLFFLLNRLQVVGFAAGLTSSTLQ